MVGAALEGLLAAAGVEGDVVIVDPLDEGRGHQIPLSQSRACHRDLLTLHFGEADRLCMGYEGSSGNMCILKTFFKTMSVDYM